MIGKRWRWGKMWSMYNGMTPETAQRRVTSVYGGCVKNARNWRRWRGWELAGDFGSVDEEYRAGRRSVGISDWGFRRHFRVVGNGAESFLQWRLSCDVREIQPGAWRWGLILNECGGVLDECMVGKFDGGEWRLICSGSENGEWWNEAESENRSVALNNMQCIEMSMGTILLCGPRIYEWFSKVIGEVVLKRFEWQRVEWKGERLELWRGNFTGGEGCLVCGEDWVMRKFWDVGAEVCVKMGGRMCGWDAYDIWRQEAGLPLCGVDLSLDRTAFEAGLDAWVSMDKGDFVGRDYLVAEQANGVRYRWIALKSVEGWDRDGDVWVRGSGVLKKNGLVVGNITSECRSPVLRGWLGLGYVRALYGKVGELLDLDLRGRIVAVQGVRRPVFLG